MNRAVRLITLLPALLLFSEHPQVSAEVGAAPAATVIPETASVWMATGQSQYEDFGSSVDAAGDVNGDGFADVIIGAPSWGPSYSQRGRALVYLGSPSGLSTEPAWSLEGTRDLANLGTSVAGAGDVNGDAYGDVIVGEFGFSGGNQPNRGRAWIIPGSRHGLRTQQAWTITGETENEYLGEVVARAGDVNGDGFDDVLIGSATRTLIVLGHPGGSVERGLVWVGPASRAPIGAGDVNGDGYDDVVLVGGFHTLLYSGSSSGPANAPIWSGPSAISGAGGGDVNGDGYSDLVLSSGSILANEVRVYLGSRNGLPPFPSWIIAEPPRPGYGYGFARSLAVRGDVNNDGFDDILVSDHDYRDALRLKPSVFCYLGKASGHASTPDWAGSEGLAADWGLNAALCGDVNGDGDSEVLAGTPGFSPGGAARLFHLGRAFPAPQLAHEPVNLGEEGISFVLEATAVDYTDYVSRVEIVHRSVYDEGFREPIVMERVEGDLYRGAIPGLLVLPGLLYFIRAVDNHGLAMRTIPIDVDLIPASSPRSSALSFQVRVGVGSHGRPDRVLFSTTRAGPARVRLFDVQGRLAGSLMDAGNLAAGPHVVPLSGTESQPASGVYFYRVDTIDGSRSGRVVMLR